MSVHGYLYISNLCRPPWSVCLSVCHTPLAPYALHGRGPWPCYWPPWAMTVLPHALHPLPARAVILSYFAFWFVCSLVNYKVRRRTHTTPQQNARPWTRILLVFIMYTYVIITITLLPPSAGVRPYCDHTDVFVQSSIRLTLTGVVDGRARAPPPKKKNPGKNFFGNCYVKFQLFRAKNHVKFGNFVNFSGKNCVKFGHFVNFADIFFGQKCIAP